MHIVLSSLMAALLGIHAFFGCCWHHGHRCAECTPSATQVAQPAKCCHHHQGTDEKQHGKQTPCKCFLECHGVCIYVPSQKVQLDSPELIVPLDFVAVLTAFSDMQQASTAPWEISRGPTAVSPPLRLHLLHQILLI